MIADELNPLTISHAARTISFNAIGRANKTAVVEKESIMPKRISNSPASEKGTPMRPQTDNHRGMSLD